MEDCKKETLDEIFGYLLGMIEQLGLEEGMLIKACEEKIKKVEQRLKENY